jgi:hypothetical protein
VATFAVAERWINHLRFFRLRVAEVGLRADGFSSRRLAMASDGKIALIGIALSQTE